MAKLFNGLATSENIEKFFLNMIISDSNMPHTSKHLSPITFTDFMSRNQIYVFNMFDVYNEACKAWVRFNECSGNPLSTAPGHKFDFDYADRPQDSWHTLIDHLKRLLHVKDIDAPYFQMHYIALVCNNFYRTTDAEITDIAEKNGYRLIWNQIINPILYDPLIPTNYFWLPIENFVDLRFASDVNIMIERVETYLKNHSGTTIDFTELDKTRLSTYRAYIEDLLAAVYKNKYNGFAAWQPAVNLFFQNSLILRLDMSLFELANTPAIGLSGFKSVKIMNRITKMRHRYESGMYNDDPDLIIDELLDILPQGVPRIDAPVNNDMDKSKKFKGCNGNQKDGGDNEAQYVKA